MNTPWIAERQQARACARHEAFWRGELEEGPLLWVTAPDARPGATVPEPASDDELWTNVDYVIASSQVALARTHYAGEALPVFCPWLGPDQFAAWLGAELELKPREATSWSRPFVEDWTRHPELRIAPDNRWWRLYLETVRESVRVGHDQWVTGYPDLHTGIDALSAIRGRERLAVDLVESAPAIHRAMRQLTALWKFVVDGVSDIVRPGGQGTSNWTMGWSEQRFLCIGQNDYTCMIGPRMFEEYCWRDTVECCRHVDVALYHLDGPGAVRHLPAVLRIESLHCIQWIQGAGQPLPSGWLDLLRQVQAAGKSVQLYYGGAHGGNADLQRELDILCAALNPNRLFLWAVVDSAETAERVVAYARRVARG